MTEVTNKKLDQANYYLLEYVNDMIVNNNFYANFKLYTAIIFWTSYCHDVKYSNGLNNLKQSENHFSKDVTGINDTEDNHTHFRKTWIPKADS